MHRISWILLLLIKNYKFKNKGLFKNQITIFEQPNTLLIVGGMS